MVSKSPDSEFQLIAGEDQRETFIPLRHHDLVKLLRHCYDLVGDDETGFARLLSRLQAIFHAEHLSALLSIENLYGPLDPDCELLKVDQLDEAQIAVQTERLFVHLARLLFSAHYQRISRDELLKAIQLSSQWGIKVDLDFDVFDHLEVFARGYRMVKVERRRWQNLYRKESIQLPEFHRLLLAFRVKKKLDSKSDLNSGVIYLKMFKNIPETELEILLPGTKVKLSPFDRGKILFPSISGAAPTLFKLYRILVVVGLGVGVTLANFWGLVFVVAALVGYVIKLILSYFRTHDKYQHELARNLYVKNLDNNAGVLYRVLNEAREQELCETILAYTLLWRNGTDEGLSSEDLDKLAEAFLEGQTGVEVNFEIHDAMAKLARLGLAESIEGNRWVATRIQAATERLNDSWSELFKSRMSERSGELDGDGESGLDQNLFTSS